MTGKPKDTDYLFVTGQVRALEARLLTGAQLERLLDAANGEQAERLLAEQGCGGLAGAAPEKLEGALGEARVALFQDLDSGGRIRDILALFRSKYDYQNAKALVKAGAMGTSADRLLTGGGRYDPALLAKDFRRGELGAYSAVFRRGVDAAREALASTGDPQRADFILDRAYFEELTGLARQTRSKFLEGYAALLIDAANLRAVVRASRLRESGGLLRRALIPGGSVPASALSDAHGERLSALFHASPLAGAAALGASLAAPGSGGLARFEELCGEAVAGYLAAGRRAAFGAGPVAAYLHARLAELDILRAVLTVPPSGPGRDAVRQRLRRTGG